MAADHFSTIYVTVTSGHRPPIPLTTIYSPPASCHSIITWDGSHFWQYGTNQTGGDCYPPKFRSILNSWYAPGICPDQWTSAGSVQTFTGYDAMCCPKGYFLSGLYHAYECAGVFRGLRNNIYSTSTAGNAKIPSDASLTSTNARHYAATVVADVIQVQWQATDREILSLLSERSSISTSAPKAVTGAVATTVTATPTDISTIMIPSPISAPLSATKDLPLPSATRISNPRSSGLSAGSKVAISVSVPLVTFTLLGIGFCLFFRRRKAEHRTSYKAELHNQAPLHQLRQEMDVQFSELPASLSATEIGGSSLTEVGGSPINEIGGRALRKARSKNFPRSPGSASILQSRC